MKGVFLASATALAIAASSAYAKDAGPAVVFDKAGKFDKSFNQGVYEGSKKYTTDTGIKVREFEPKNEAQVEQGLRRLAKRGYSPIVAVGFNQTSAVEKVAKDFPDTKFTIIDGVINLPNVQSIVFKEHEGSFLVGALAAMTSKTDTVGFVGGMDIPLIRKFGCGYEQGAKYISSDAKVIQNMTGSTGAAFNDPTKGSELAKGQFSQGADVVFAAAGGTGIGVYQAAADAGKYAIGVDSNQNYLHPGVMLTSMVKRVDQAAYNTYEAAANGSWTSGITVLGLAENGVGWAYDDNNKSLITDDMKSKMDDIRAKIVSGDIKVHDYMATNSCTY
ncbi:BMP family ABC transporter substrate-binding protein [Marinomonas mediterranea]|jgi:nucleoside-binding protein|uniref:Basic membrane lipoprotein n=1 Tax=Marinomonas mediterranea (strain ATCC 700492 / JCM 21426 / NBRC 103028 / MMB-1) TaxID=717774 RepID=F2K099_MARM1|nr:BMP family ABC transporter substrate-binding protein [Marinomonas mediterranea]ADZ89814.1 basic membrane lipoprotein [Marinomonas mediterranea MMB-1]WCN11998.1 BMP family ABC transporter substrate-binding protein [Marinomonas mediterranea]WCN16035.1 BMP family ABC transporter substrate-binding protein [Marinomonas mediterranea MMB-1]